MTRFKQGLEQFLGAIQLEVPQSVRLELDHFMPDDWTSAVEHGVYYVNGPAGPGWTQVVRRLVGVVAYAEGSVLLQVSPERWELYTWWNDEGQGFKVIFLAMSPSG
jgi:hypothetical protein